MSLAKNIFIVGAKRTPFGAYGGKLKNMTSSALGVVASTAALQQANVDPSKVESVVFGNVVQTQADAAYLARHIALKSGVAIETPCLTINRLCGSGFQSVVSCIHEMNDGASIALAGGTESMSQSPYALYNSRFGTTLGKDLNLVDTLWAGLTDSHIKTPMAITAENLAEKYNVTRQDADEVALKSQLNHAKATENKAFDNEIAPVELKGRKGKVEQFTSDEHPRPQSTMESLGKLPAVFKKEGVVTAGNASGICDGAGALVLADEDAVKKHSLKPLARVVSYHSSGVDPAIMGIGPAPAVRAALEKANLTLDDMSFVEVNEAFAAQVCAVQRELNINPEKLNVNGGAVALGHPLAASGSRILAHLTHLLATNSGAKYAVGSACIGGGQGIAVVLESV